MCVLYNIFERYFQRRYYCCIFFNLGAPRLFTVGENGVDFFYPRGCVLSSVLHDINPPGVKCPSSILQSVYILVARFAYFGTDGTHALGSYVPLSRNINTL